MAWRRKPNENFEKELKSAIGRDGGMRSRVEKKMAKILENPKRAGENKSGNLAGFKSEQVGHYVILFRLFEDSASPPGQVEFCFFWHHNDSRYDP